MSGKRFVSVIYYYPATNVVPQLVYRMLPAGVFVNKHRSPAVPPNRA